MREPILQKPPNILSGRASVVSHTRDRRGLLRRHVSRAADEAAHPVRKVDDYLAALLWHSAVPVLCAGRWNPKNSLLRHLQSAANAKRKHFGAGCYGDKIP